METEIEEQPAYPYRRLQLRGNQNVQIRILILEPATSPSAPIVCRLVSIFTDERPSYETLSYTWGSEEEPVAISIHGHSVNVRRNLHAALIACRWQDIPRRLWIDAICINQADNIEKSNMVRNMHVVFHRAERTIVWLGPASEDSELAMDIVERIGRDADSAESKQQIAMLHTISDLPHTREVELQWAALGHLFGRPYFSRTWIVQEIAFSWRIIVKCAAREVSYTELVHTCCELAAFTEVTPRLLVSTNTSMQLRGMRTVMLGEMLGRMILRAYVQTGQVIRQSLADVLAQMRGFRSTDPRDKVYGCMMLASLPPRFQQFHIDYDQSCGELYSRVARVLIEHESSLRMLSYCDTYGQEGRKGDYGESLTLLDGYQRVTIPNLPSWAPNWATVCISPPLAGGRIERLGNLELLGFSLRPREDPYRASGDLTAEYSFSDDSTSLIVKGLVLDVVKARTDNTYCRPPHEFIMQVHNLDEQCRNALGEYHYPKEAIRTTLVANRNSLGKKLTTDDMANLLEDESGTLFLTRVRDNMVRVFFTTSSNVYLGLGPLGMRMDDLVCLIKGCHVPMILRRVRVVDGVESEDLKDVSHGDASFYRVIGPAYVHGVMEGEVAARLEGDEAVEFVLR